MKHQTTPKFSKYHERLPFEIRKLADKNYDLLKTDSSHPSLHFKKVGRFWSMRVGLHYRALAVQENDDCIWFWIGRHDEYDALIGRR